MALVEAVTSRAVWRRFEAHEPLSGAWRYLMGAAALHTVSAVSGHVFPVMLGLPESLEEREQLRVFGLEVLNWLSTACLGAGLLKVLLAQRRLGLKWRLRWTERTLLLVMAAWAFLQIHEFSQWAGSRDELTVLAVLRWGMDPLLVAIFVVGILVWSGARLLQPGLIGRTWWAYTLAGALTTLGNIGSYVVERGIVDLPWGGVFWLLWYVQAALFAIAPLYQYRAMTELAADGVFDGGPSQTDWSERSFSTARMKGSDEWLQRG